MSRLLSGKKREGGLGERTGSVAELRQHPDGPDTLADSDNYNPFVDDDPFQRNHGFETDRSQVVEEILRAHAGSDGRGIIERKSPAGMQLHEVPLYDVTLSDRRAVADGSDVETFQSRLPLGNPFPASSPITDYREQEDNGGTSNPFWVEAPFQPAHSEWAKRSSAAESYQLATPQQQQELPHREPSRQQSLTSIGASDGWDRDSAPLGGVSPSRGGKKGRGFHLWGGKKEEKAQSSLPTSHPPSFGVMVPPPQSPPSNGRLWGHSSKAEDLDKRERELARREGEVARREEALARGGGVVKANNWPRFWPLVHHDIRGEVPAHRQAMVRTGYLAWLVVCTGYLYNWLLITIMFATGEKSVALWLFATMVAGFGVPLSFLCWYRSLYFVAISDGAIRWTWYFVHMLVNFVWCWWMFVGIQPKLGGFSAGLFTMIGQFSDGGGKGTAFGILSIFNMAVWATGGVLAFYLLGWSYKVFRGRGPASPPPAGPPTRQRTRRGAEPGGV